MISEARKSLIGLVFEGLTPGLATIGNSFHDSKEKELPDLRKSGSSYLLVTTFEYIFIFIYINIAPYSQPFQTSGQ